MTTRASETTNWLSKGAALLGCAFAQPGTCARSDYDAANNPSTSSIQWMDRDTITVRTAHEQPITNLSRNRCITHGFAEMINHHARFKGVWIGAHDTERQ
jgi:hypothetical protein